MTEIDISVIIPLHNEEGNILPLYQELAVVMDRLALNFEIILVDDGSTDGTFSKMFDIYRIGEKVRLIRLLRRYGQSAAIQAGINEAKGGIIILMDGDLQSNPQDIPALLGKLNQGYNLVNGWRRHRKDPFFTKIVPSYIANLMIRKITRVQLHDFGCGFKIFRSEVIRDNFILGSMHRLFALYVTLKGYKTTEIVVDHRSRTQGKTKYGLIRIYELFLEMFRIYFFENHLAFPLYFFGISGLLLIGLGIITGIFIIIRKLLFSGVWLSPLFFITIILVSLGIQIILMGIIAEILVRILLQQNKRQTYIIKEIKSR